MANFHWAGADRTDMRCWAFCGVAPHRTQLFRVIRLRQKLEADPNCPRHFLTLHKVGYRFLVREQDSAACAETLQIALESMPGLKTMMVQSPGAALVALRCRQGARS
jgi:hypothetical protein